MDSARASGGANEAFDAASMLRKYFARVGSRAAEGQGGESDGNVSPQAVWIRPKRALELGRKLTVVIRLVAYDSKQVAQRSSVVLAVSPKIFEQRGVELFGPVIARDRGLRARLERAQQRSIAHAIF
jgi:hypothetical protein